jgi:hypothetical protein
MHIPQTFALLGLLTIGVLVLRHFWWRLPRPLRAAGLVFALAMIAIRLLFLVTLWSTTSTRLNALLYWTAVLGYQIVLARFSLMRPRWLTAPCAIILLLPLFGSTLLLPLTRVFEWQPADISAIGGPYLLEKSPWDTSDIGNSGVDLMVFYHPPFAPFLRHLSQRSSFSAEECDIAHASAAAFPDRKLVHFHCPARDEKHPAIDHMLPLH